MTPTINLIFFHVNIYYLFLQLQATKPNTTKANIHLAQLCQHKLNTKNKARFCCLKRPLAWTKSSSGAKYKIILLAQMNMHVNYLLRVNHYMKEWRLWSADKSQPLQHRNTSYHSYFSFTPSNEHNYINLSNSQLKNVQNFSKWSHVQGQWTQYHNGRVNKPMLTYLITHST